MRVLPRYIYEIWISRIYSKESTPRTMLTALEKTFHGTMSLMILKKEMTKQERQKRYFKNEFRRTK